MESTISAPVVVRSLESTAFTAALVPTGMNTGVRTSPWGVFSHPVRAAPSVACDVTTAVTLAVAAGQQMAQFRLRLDQVSDNDGVADLVMFFISSSNVNETGIFTLGVTVQPAAQ